MVKNAYISLILFSLFSFTLTTNGQELDTCRSEQPVFTIYDTISYIPFEEEIIPMGMQRKTEFSMEIGTSFMTDTKGSWQNTTYFSPHLSKQISNRFSVYVGAGIAQNSSFGNQSDPLGSYYYNAPPQSIIYAGGRYQVNEKLALYGSVYKTFNLNSGFSENSFELPEGWGATVGAQYHINENAFFEIQMEFSKNSYNQNGNNFFCPIPTDGPASLDPTSRGNRGL